MKLSHLIKRWLGIHSPSGRWTPPPKLDIAAGPLTGYRSISQGSPCDALCGLFPHPDHRTARVVENGPQRPYDGRCRGNYACEHTTWAVGPDNHLVPPQKGCDGC